MVQADFSWKTKRTGDLEKSTSLLSSHTCHISGGQYHTSPNYQRHLMAACDILTLMCADLYCVQPRRDFECVRLDGIMTARIM